MSGYTYKVYVYNLTGTSAAMPSNASAYTTMTSALSAMSNAYDSDTATNQFLTVSYTPTTQTDSYSIVWPYTAATGSVYTKAAASTSGLTGTSLVATPTGYADAELSLAGYAYSVLLKDGVGSTIASYATMSAAQWAAGSSYATSNMSFVVSYAGTQQAVGVWASAASGTYLLSEVTQARSNFITSTGSSIANVLGISTSGGGSNWLDANLARSGYSYQVFYTNNSLEFNGTTASGVNTILSAGNALASYATMSDALAANPYLTASLTAGGSQAWDAFEVVYSAQSQSVTWTASYAAGVPGSGTNPGSIIGSLPSAFTNGKAVTSGVTGQYINSGTGASTANSLAAATSYSGYTAYYAYSSGGTSYATMDSMLSAYEDSVQASLAASGASSQTLYSYGIATGGNTVSATSTVASTAVYMGNQSFYIIYSANAESAVFSTVSMSSFAVAESAVTVDSTGSHIVPPTSYTDANMAKAGYSYVVYTYSAAGSNTALPASGAPGLSSYATMNLALSATASHYDDDTATNQYFVVQYIANPTAVGASTGILSGDIARLLNAVVFDSNDTTNYLSSASYSNAAPASFYDSNGSLGAIPVAGSALPSEVAVDFLSDNSGHLSGGINVSGLTPGNYTFYVSYTDAHGNVVSVQNTIQVSSWTLPFTGGEGIAGLVGLAGMLSTTAISLLLLKKTRASDDFDEAEASGRSTSPSYRWTRSGKKERDLE
jgi:hypothetical protein